MTLPMIPTDKRSEQESATRTNEASKTKGKRMVKKNNERPVIVTTEHRGVFFGYAENTSGETIALKRARLCVYWSADLRGFMGLASHGPNKNCKIGQPADIELRDITSVVEVTPEAVARWEQGPWA